MLEVVYVDLWICFEPYRRNRGSRIGERIEKIRYLRAFR